MLKRVPIAAVLFLLVLLPAVASAASPRVQVDRVRYTPPVDGRVAILVGIRYPIEMIGRSVQARVRVAIPGVRARAFRLRARAGASQPRHAGERRFVFVHKLVLDRRLSRLIVAGASPRVGVVGIARLDVDRDGSAEWVSRARRGTRVVPRAGRLQCETPPQLRARPGRRISLALPRCGARLRWTKLAQTGPGRVRIRDGRLLYRSPQGFRGSVSIRIVGAQSAGAGVGARASRLVEIKVGSAQTAVVRAVGDSVTAGFGYYDDGKTMPLANLLSCEPGERFYNDACSSNSTSRSNKGKKIEYAPDYGLANNVSWAAQWANAHGVANYKNFAVTGSEPKNWLPGGYLNGTLKQVASEDPDYVLMTMGANPLLSEMLFGVDNMGCAIESDVLGGYRECIERAFAGVDLRGNLEALYGELVADTDATIFLMQYHLSVPSSALAYTATQIAEMGSLLNREIASVAAEVDPRRLHVVTPPHFAVGIDISPVYPSAYSCSLLDFKVDGPSVQSTLTQDELTVLHPLSFCSGPPSGPPWVISGDTGIHPSAAGYAQMASQVPAPVG